MSEGRLAPVRETDRHASIVAGGAAAVCGVATFAALYSLDVRPNLGDGSESFATTFPFLTAVAAGLGLVAGCVEGAIAARSARQAADRFASLTGFCRKVFALAAIANVLLATIAVSVAFGGADRIVAIAISAAVAVGASGLGAALFGWSHAVDWPHVPEYLRQPAPTQRPAPLDTRSEEHTPAVDMDIESARSEVVNEPRSRRSSAKNVDDEVWQEIQDLITGK